MNRTAPDEGEWDEEADKSSLSSSSLFFIWEVKQLKVTEVQNMKDCVKWQVNILIFLIDVR